MHLAPDEEYVQHHILSSGLAEVDIVGHTSLDILEDLSAEVFVGSKGYPRGLSHLVNFAQWVYRRLELVGVLYGAEVMRAQRIVRLARPGEVGRP